MAKVKVTFEFDSPTSDTAATQAKLFLERRILPTKFHVSAVTCDGENLLTTDKLLAGFKFCVLCLSGEHRPEVHS